MVYIKDIINAAIKSDLDPCPTCGKPESMKYEGILGFNIKVKCKACKHEFTINVKSEWQAAIAKEKEHAERS